MDLSELWHGFVKIDSGISLSWYMEFVKIDTWILLVVLHGFVKVATWICQSCYMELLKLLHGFVKAVPYISRPLPNKTKLRFDQDFKAC